MEHHDLSQGGATEVESFRDAHLPRVRAYVAVVCAPERSDEVEAAALVDFLARTGGAPAPTEQLERELLRATRSAAAGRFNVVVPLGRPESHLSAECRAMPELLALHANGGRPEDEALIAGHLAGCAACAHTLDRMHEAERAFARGVGDLPALEPEETVIDTSKARAAVSPVIKSNPVPKAEASPVAGLPQDQPPSAPATDAGTPADPGTPPATYRRRSGGLVGAVRKLVRPPGG